MLEFRSSDLLDPQENINIHKVCHEGSIQMHTHDFIELVFIRSGRGQHVIDEVCYSVERGDLLLVNFKQTHSFTCAGELTYVNCLIKPEFISKELVDSENAFELLALTSFDDFFGKVDCSTPKVSFRRRDLIEVEAIIEQMLIEFHEKRIGYRSILKNYTSILLSKTFREMRNSDHTGVYNHVNRITPDILKYIEEKCLEKVTLTDLARQCFYNPSYFSRIFSGLP